MTTSGSFPKEGGAWADLGGCGEVIEEGQCLGQGQKSEPRGQLSDHELCDLKHAYSTRWLSLKQTK